MHVWRRIYPLLIVLLLLDLTAIMSAPNAAVAEERSTLTYFALGDSFASGHGLFDDGPDCRRSQYAYPHWVSDALSATYMVDVHHLACSGATAGTNTDTSDPDKSISHQFQTVNDFLDNREGTDPVLVTITIGANDVGLLSPGTFFQVFGRFNSATGFFEWLDGKDSSIASSLTPGIDNLMSHEDVYVVLTDYPNPFPEGAFFGNMCNDIFFSLSCYEALNRTVQRLNSIMLDQFLQVNRPSRLRVAPLGTSFSSHTVGAFTPGTSFPFLNCLTDTDAPNSWFQSDCVHPTKSGAQAIADVVFEQAMKILPAPVSPPKTQEAPQAGNATESNPASSTRTFHLPWESGSVWQITVGNGEGEHAGGANFHGFDAVAVPGRSTDKVVAVAAGTVMGFQDSMPDTALVNSGHAGNCVIIDHGDSVYSLYAHLAQGSIPLSRGQHITSGSVIGTMGNSGFSTGPHLHWAVLNSAWMYTDPNVSPYETCSGRTIESRYGDPDNELQEDGGIPRTGRYYESFNSPGGNSGEVTAPVQPSPVEAEESAPDISTTPAEIEEPAPDVQVSSDSIPANTSQPIEMIESEQTSTMSIASSIDCGGTNSCPGVVYVDMVVTTEDGDFLDTCTVTIDPRLPLPGCNVQVPVGIAVVITEDVSTLPAGYVPEENPVHFDTANIGHAQYDVGFRNIFQGVTTSTEQTTDVEYVKMGIAAKSCDSADSCWHEVGAQFTVTTLDDEFIGACTLPGPYVGIFLSCHVEVPKGITVVVTEDVGTITPGYVPEENPIYFDTDYVDPNFASHWGPIFYNGPESGHVGAAQASDVAIAPTENGTSISGESGASIDPTGAVDIALITRDPDNGKLLRDACYVLVDFSNEGCDENVDGQVTFAAIPYGAYTVRQTRTPVGYPKVNDVEINVKPVEGMPASEPFGVPLGFVVKQAPEQNAPATRNVSVVLMDMKTHERVTAGVCVELVGASNVGCDEDLIDGQVDFLDVPAGGPYELRFSNLPVGYEVGVVGGPLAVSIDAGPGAPANRMIFVLLAGPQSGITGPADVSISSSTGEATVLMTFRGCPEGFNPNLGNFSVECTVPLDAPDASIIVWGGDGQGGMSITGLDRQYDGAYIYNAGPMTMNLQLSGLAPVVRDAYQVVGADGGNGSTYTINLVDGETRQVFVFYYFE